ncbi:hypothetical protein BB558_004359 [Smittium angustum]|uniref:RING-type E3 ubiquitin transferase n=1 Tax=Smittium angustum TaxID=133377 RepID=A0A2U1J3Q0_SMIAN|nr:hypothetical protein BB558_004359 [Smittium angustum]
MASKSIDSWENSAYSKVLGLPPTTLSKSNIEISLIDLLENISSSQNSHSFSFLFDSWKNASQISTNLKGPRAAAVEPTAKAQRIQSIDFLSKLLLSYAGLSLQDDSLFSGNSSAIFISLITSDPSSVAPWFLQLVSHFHNDGLDDILSNTFKTLNQKILSINNLLDPNLWQYIKAFEFLSENQTAAQTITQIPWFSKGLSREIQTSSLLGPLFSISTFPDEDNGGVKSYFEGLESRSKSDKISAMNGIQNSVNLLQSAQFRILNSIARASKQAREALLKWAASAIFSNTKRTGFQADPLASVSDGFADNLAMAFLNLSLPFSNDPQLLKTTKVDIIYWPSLRIISGKLDSIQTTNDNEQPTNSDIIKTTWSQLTRLCASTEEALEWDKSLLKANESQINEPGFISDCFFLTSLAINIGPLATMSKFQQSGKSFNELQEYIDRMETSQNSNNPQFGGTAMLERFKNHLNMLKWKRLAMQSNVMDPRRLLLLLNFSRFTLSTLLDLHFFASSPEANLTENQLSSNLISQKENAWKCFPEYLLEDQLTLIIFVARYAPDALMSPELSPMQPGISLLSDLVVSISIAVLSKSELVRNPHLKSKLVDVLHSITYSPPEDDSDYVDTNYSVSVAASSNTNPLSFNNLSTKRFSVHPLIAQFISSLNTNVSNHLPNSSKLALLKKRYPSDNLVMVLLKLYVEIEHTGASSAFYDKFSVRYHIARILRSLWEQPQSQHLKMTYLFFNSDSSITHIVDQFVSRMVSDTTYLLDESLSKLVTIKNLEQSIKSPPPENENNDQENSQDNQQELASAERQASSYITLAHETVHMLSFLTRLVPTPFRSDSIILRLASMLNYNLGLLAGPKCSNLKVSNMYERFHFEPKILLSELLAVYVHLGFPKSVYMDQSEINNEQEFLKSIKNNPPLGKNQNISGVSIEDANETDEIKEKNFIEALAQDQRSWNKKVFKSSLALCTKYNLKHPKSIELLNNIINKVEKAIRIANEQDSLLGFGTGGANDSSNMNEVDIPEEYLDPIMYTLMEDPCLLPTSQTIVDYKTIKGYLLTDPRDPFNRKPLDINDVVRVPELKAEIQEFKRSKLEKYK